MASLLEAVEGEAEVVLKTGRRTMTMMSQRMIHIRPET